MDFNCLKEGEKPNWNKYCHFYVQPCVAADLQGDGKTVVFESISLEEEVRGDIRAEVWTIFGLTSEGESELIHDAPTRDKASEVVKYCLGKMNKARNYKTIANEVICNFKFDLPDFDPYKYDEVEHRPVKFHLEVGVYEECNLNDDPTSWSVYGHLMSPEVGGSECIHDCATEPEMKQLVWVLATIFQKN